MPSIPVYWSYIFGDEGLRANNLAMKQFNNLLFMKLFPVFREVLFVPLKAFWGLKV